MQGLSVSVPTGGSQEQRQNTPLESGRPGHRQATPATRQPSQVASWHQDQRSRVISQITLDGEHIEVGGL